jgi:hypothetical protein
MSIKLDMTEPMTSHHDTYKYFETTATSSNAMGPGGGHFSSSLSLADQNNFELTSLPDPSLRASTFWRIFPHVFSLIFLWFFSALYLNTNLWIFYPLLYLTFILLLMFIILFQQNIFEKTCIPGLFNNLAWSIWSYIAFWLILSFILQQLLPMMFNNTNNDTMQTDFASNKKQIEIIFTCIFLTAFAEQILECYLCHRAFNRYFVNAAGFSSINCLILYSTVIGIGIGIAKSLISIALLSNSSVDDLHQGFIIDYKYALLDYIAIPFIANHENDKEHEWVFVLISALVLVAFHASNGCLWGIGFVRRFVLEHTLAFSQILMFPWFALICVHLVIAEIFYNVMSYNFSSDSSRAIYLSVCVCTPLLFTIFNIAVAFFLYRRTIEPAVDRIQTQHSYDMAM